jgi:hypothetical protein
VSALTSTVVLSHNTEIVTEAQEVDQRLVPATLLVSPSDTLPVPRIVQLVSFILQISRWSGRAARIPHSVHKTAVAEFKAKDATMGSTGNKVNIVRNEIWQEKPTAIYRHNGNVYRGWGTSIRAPLMTLTVTLKCPLCYGPFLKNKKGQIWMKCGKYFK